MILTEGKTRPNSAKTAACLVRYRREEIVALLDSTQAGKTSQELLGVGGDLPVVASLARAPAADTLLIGIAPSGGRLPAEMRAAVLDAIRRSMNIVSGLHEFLADDPEFAAAARAIGVTITDVRRNDERDVATREGIDPRCLRIHTVGQDCSVGKMVVSVELARALARRGHDAKFVATGQTGILIEGDGCPIDGVVADFVNGAAEKLVRRNQHHEILVIEGQGSITHPRYSAVTLGLLHGCMPQGLILCYEMGRTHIHGMESIPVTPLDEIVRLNEQLASTQSPARVIGVAMNSARFGAEEADAERRRIERGLGLPSCDVIRHGPDVLVDACLALKRTLAR